MIGPCAKVPVLTRLPNGVAPHALPCRCSPVTGLRDVDWLVLSIGSPGSFGGGGARWLKGLGEGLTLPMHGVLDRVVLQPLLSAARQALGVGGQGRGGSGGEGVHVPGLSSIRARGAAWAAQGASVCFLHTPNHCAMHSPERLGILGGMCVRYYRDQQIGNISGNVYRSSVFDSWTMVGIPFFFRSRAHCVYSGP